jgi:hypothetical protein
MLRAGYNVKMSAGVITAGGCLGILIPPSVMLIVYGATAVCRWCSSTRALSSPGSCWRALHRLRDDRSRRSAEFAPPLSEKDATWRFRARRAVAKSRDERALGGLWRSFRTAPDLEIRSKLRNDFIVTVLPAIAS